MSVTWPMPREWGKAWENAEDEWVIFAYDGASRLRRAVNGGWNQNLQPTTTCDVHRDYDHAGRLTMDKQDIDGENNGLGPLEVHYEYDPTLRGTNGKPTRMYVGPGPGYDYDFRYDEMGRFAQILPHGSTNPSFQYSYDNASNETQRDNFLTHIKQIYDPDELNRTRKVELQYNNSRFWLESYGYDPMSRLRTVTRGSWQDQFNYYLDGELRSVFYDATPADAPDPNEIPPAEDPDKEKTVDDFVALPASMEPDAPQTVHTVTYNLDNAGNRVGVTDSLSGTTSYYPNNINQYDNNVGSDAINNGAEHEISSYKSVSYTYMKDEHLVRATSGTGSYDFAYDALGRCIKRTVRTQMEGPESSPRPTPTPHPPPTPAPRPSPPPPSPTPPPGITEVTKYYIYDGDRPILEYDGNGELAGYNLYGKGVDEILLRNDPTLPAPQTVYYQQDHEGSVTFLTYLPPQGVSSILEYYRYDVFGKPAIYGPPPNWSQRGASLYSNRFLFTGREYAAAFGFYEYRARAYHPTLGRFMSEDPKLFVHGAGFEKPPEDWTFGAHPDEAEFNLFRYCHNDPVNKNDPTGLTIEFADHLSLAERIQVIMIAARVAETPEGAAAINTMAASQYTNTITLVTSGSNEGTRTTPNILANASNGTGTGTRVRLDTSATERTRTDGTKEVVPPSVTAGHEFGHAASTNNGTQPPADPTAKGANYIKQPSESKSDSIKVENAVRKLEKLNPRD